MTFSSTVDDESFTKEVKPVEHTINRPIELNKHENSYVFAKRNAFWIANPQMLYIFGALPKSNFYLLGQTLLLLISISALFFTNFYAVFTYTETVVGLGDISGQTWVDRFSALITVFIIFRANKHLKNNLKQKPIKGYQLTMLSNSMMKALVNQLKLLLLIFIISAAYGLLKYQETSQIFSEIRDGSFADNLGALCYLIGLIITYRAFRFCKKELV
ncbi:MAG: hypothetical protein ACJAXS_002138 [Colwellia sp.]